MEKINIQAFLAVADMGSFRKAADSLGYTQAGMSYIISAMEESMGLPLFVREHNGVRLTAEGEALLPQMRQIEIENRRLEQMIGELKGLEQGTLRIQIFDSISIHWIPGIISEFQEKYPGVRIELISEEDSVRQEQMVMSGEVDCGFFLTGVQSNIDVFPLMEENLMAIVALDHPLANEGKFPIAKLAEYPYISMKYDSHTGIEDIFRRHYVMPNTAFCMDNDYAAMAMVSKGLGYCIFAELLLRDVPYEIKCMEFDEPQKRVISVGTRSIDTASSVCRKFIEHTREWVQLHGRAGDRR